MVHAGTTRFSFVFKSTCHLYSESTFLLVRRMLSPFHWSVIIDFAYELLKLHYMENNSTSLIIQISTHCTLSRRVTYVIRFVLVTVQPVKVKISSNVESIFLFFKIGLMLQVREFAEFSNRSLVKMYVFLVICNSLFSHMSRFLYFFSDF